MNIRFFLVELIFIIPSVIICAQSSDKPDFLGKDRLNIQLPDNKLLDVYRESVTTHPSGSQSWVGRIYGQKWGYVIISATRSEVFGKVETDEGEVYLLTIQGRHDDLIEAIELNQPLTEGRCNDTWSDAIMNKNDTREEGDQNRTAAEICQGDVCDDQTIDVIVFYTPRARQNMGGSGAIIEAAIASAVSEMNMISANSGINHRVSLVYTGEIAFSEASDFQTNLTRLRVPNDGYIDQIHDIRDYYYADLVSLIVGTDECGQAHVNVDSIQYDATLSFSVVRESCLMNKTFAHELGHNLGFRHDRYAYLDEDDELPNISCDYAWGWVNPSAQFGGTTTTWRTVMTYPNQCSDWGVTCTRIPYWSNHAIMYNDEPMGSTPDLNGASNAFHFDRSACQVSQFRVPPDCDSDCQVFQGCANYNLNTDLGPGNITAIEVLASFPQADPSVDIIEVCIMYFGDHNGTGEQFNILDEDNQFIGRTTPVFECDIPSRVCFDVDSEIYNEWIDDKSVEFFLNPVGTTIDPETCRANRACAEILFHDNSEVSAVRNTMFEYNVIFTPNPVDDKGELIVEADRPVVLSLSICDIQGRKIVEFDFGRLNEGTNVIQIDLSDLPSGAYFGHLKSDDRFGVIKVAVVK